MHKPQSSSTVPLLAHRGYAAQYPENTLEALSAAVEAGATLLEFDIQLTRDHVPILLHDADFSRTGNSSARAMDIDFTQTQNIPVGEVGKFGQTFAAVRAPALTAVVEALKGWSDVTAFVEIKRQSLEHFGVADVLNAVLPVISPVINQCVVISFNAEVLFELKERLDLKTGWALRRYAEDSRRMAEQLAPDYLFCNETKLPPRSESLWPGAWEWVVYEIVDPPLARDLIERGVGIIETKDYANMANALRD